jgi:hypothetical protein
MLLGTKSAIYAFMMFGLFVLLGYVIGILCAVDTRAQVSEAVSPA